MSDRLETLHSDTFKLVNENTKFYVVNEGMKNLLISKCTIPADRIEIMNAPKSYSLRLNSNGSGTVSGDGTFEEGETVTIKAVPNDAHKFNGWTVNSDNVALEDSTSAQTTFVMPDGDVEITANFVSTNETVETPNKDLIFNVITKPEGETNGTVSVIVNNKDLTSVDIPETIKDKDGNPYTVIEVKGNAFKDCINLQHIKLPNTIITIGQGAFEGCTSLVQITIPKSVELIKDNAFLNCTSLIKVIIVSLNLQIAENAFTGMSSNAIFMVLSKEIKTVLILCHILEMQIVVLNPELNLQGQIDRANEVLTKNYPTLDEVMQSTIDLSNGIVDYFNNK